MHNITTNGTQTEPFNSVADEYSVTGITDTCDITHVDWIWFGW